MADAFGWNSENWDDMLVGATQLRSPAANFPAWAEVGSSGLYLPKFPDNATKLVLFETQLSHMWQEDTDMYLHVHWQPLTTDTGNVHWQVFYNVAPINGVFNGAGNIDTALDMLDSGDGTLFKHQMTPAHQTSGTGLNNSAVFYGYIQRNHGSDDTFSGDVALMSLDWHYQRNKAGSYGDH